MGRASLVGGEGARRFAGWTLLATMLAASPPGEASAQARPAQVSIGIAFSFTDSGRDGDGTGAGALVEYVSAWTGWASGRLYGGGFLTSANRGSCLRRVRPCSVSSQIAVFGFKGRLTAPTPYVAPFVELGLGASAGSIETRLGALGLHRPVDEGGTGFFVHVPFSLGVAFGSRRQHDVSFKYLSHPGRDHVVGILSVGIGLSWQ